MCSTRGACLACKAAAVGTVEGASRRQPWSVPRLRGRPSACDIFQRFGRGSSGLSYSQEVVERVHQDLQTR